MAALLRQGARRIGGSLLQRTQAAVASPAAAEEQRRLLPRRMYSTEEREQVMRAIQQKKEELYDAIAKGEQSFWTRSFGNIRLQQLLSVQVSPRPWDSDWRHNRYARRVNGAMEVAGFIALGGIAGYTARQYKRCLDAREALWAEAMAEN